MEGLERIKVLSSEIEDKALLKIIEHLLSREDMNEKYLNEEKSIKQMVSYIKSEAYKQAKNNMAFVDDEVVFGWAIHYWDESNEKLGLVKKEEPKKVEPQEPEEDKSDSKEEIIENKKETKWQPEGQLTIFDL